MFEKELIEKLQRIFKTKAVTLEQPGDSKEQEKLFIEIDLADIKPTPPSIVARVEGTGTMFGNGEKLPFGFFTKAIETADPKDKVSFFFHDIEGNSKLIGNLVQRTFSFVYFFHGQYDPDQGKIDTVNLSVEEN